jgi:hypothetical protein
MEAGPRPGEPCRAESGAQVTPKVSFRVTTYYKRQRGDTGLTQVSSRRLDAEDALNWVLCEIPPEAITHSRDGDVDSLTIDWSKVPDEIREGTS